MPDESLTITEVAALLKLADNTVHAIEPWIEARPSGGRNGDA